MGSKRGNILFCLYFEFEQYRQLDQMPPTLNIRDFLHDTLANKGKAKLTLDQLDKLLEMAGQIQKFSEKGLLLMAFSEQLYKISNTNFRQIKKFLKEFLAGLKPEKQRRPRQEGERLRRKRRKPAQVPRGAKDIEQIVQESLSNPSQMEKARVGVQTRSQQGIDSKSSKEINSKSEEKKKDFEYAQALGQISEGNEYITDQISFEPHQEEPIEQFTNTTSSSTSQSFGIVSNISEKLDLLKRRPQDPQKKTKTAVRGPKVEATVTKKKTSKDLLFDKNLTLEKTKPSLSERTQMEDRSVSYEYSPWLDQYYEDKALFTETDRQLHEQIREVPLSMLNNVRLSARKEPNRREMFEEIPTDYTQFDTGYQAGSTYHDFTSQPLPDFEEGMQSQVHLQEMSIFSYDEPNPTLQQISSKANRPQALVFYEMLAKMQKGEIVMTQQNPQQFGEIRIELLRN